MKSRQRLLRVIILLLGVILAGTIGYIVIERWSFFDALYMTVITISTVGYEEVHPLSNGGRIFSSALIVGGVGIMLYSATALVQYIIEGHFPNIFGRRRMKEKIEQLKGHIILCGYGRVGQEAAKVFESEGVAFVIIDENEETIAKAIENGYLSLHGEATNDDILKEAGMQKAKGLVAALDSDADNLYLTLSAKVVRPELFVVARGSNEESEAKLKRAGADRIILPYRIGGRRMALLTLRPLVVDFIDTTMHSRKGELILENVKVTSESPLAGTTVKEGLGCCGAMAILAVRKKDDKLIPNPPEDTLLEADDELVIIGTREQLRMVGGQV
ncbi:MAG: potassium channel protein [Dehalococcoidales bacterium]